MASLGRRRRRLGRTRRHRGAASAAFVLAPHLGATPIAVAQTQRTLFAKQLLDETDLPMTGVALAAGFASVRRFNTAMRQIYRRPPSELRRGRVSHPRPNGESPGLRIALAYRPPYDWSAIAAYLGARGTPGVEAASPSSYRRTLRLSDRAGWIEVAPVPGKHRLVVHLHTGAPAHLATLRRPRAPTVRPGCRSCRDPLPPGERRSLGADHRGATGPACRRRLGRLRTRGARHLGTTGERARRDDAHRARRSGIRRAAARGVAGPGRIATALPDTTRAGACTARNVCGIIRARAEAIRTLAAAVADGKILLDGSRAGEAERVGCSFPVSGPGPLRYIALRALREPDAFPESDLGLRCSPTSSARRVRSAPAHCCGRRKPGARGAAMPHFTFGPGETNHVADTV